MLLCHIKTFSQLSSDNKHNELRIAEYIMKLNEGRMQWRRLF